MITVGADPEVFVSMGEGFLPAPGLVPGNKKEPFPVKKGAIQVDGLALEFNIDPVQEEEDFVVSLKEVMSELSKRLPEGASLAKNASATFTEEQLDALDPKHLIIGCDPDYNAYTSGSPNPPLVLYTGTRFAGGHIHVGWTSDASIRDPSHIGSCITLVRLLDQYLGVPSVLLDPDDSRRKAYGKAGSFRPRSYGVEYRTLSNFWLQEEKYVRWVYRTIQLITFDPEYQQDLDLMDEVEDIINQSDREAAEEFIQEHGIVLP